MGQSLFDRAGDDDPQRHLYDMGMAAAKERIRNSFFFICMVPSGDAQNYSLQEQIAYAKQLRKPIYVILSEGSQQPDALRGADVRATEVIRRNESVDSAVQRLFTVVRKEFPGILHAVEAPDLNDVVDWPPKERKPEF